MTIHRLKCWMEYFNAIIQGGKTFEVRYYDRDFKVGDILELQEYDMKKDQYTGRSIQVEVTYIMLSGVGVVAGWVVMAIRPYRLSLRHR